MAELDNLVPIIQAHIDELQQPGVVSIRPGYRMENNWPTKQPTIVVVVSRDAGDAHLPASIDGAPVDVRKATPVEELRFQDPDQYNAIAQHRSEIRGGAFPEFDPVATEDTSIPADESEMAFADFERGGPKKSKSITLRQM